jgi:adenosylhomocysteine nucleosidase
VSPTATGPGRIVAVTGLAREARIAASPDVHTVIGGGDEAALSAELKQVVAQGAQGIISFGIAGGLDPALAPGTCIVGSAVSMGPARWRTDVLWSKRLLAALPGAVFAEIAGIDHPAASVEHKRLLRSMTGASAVDMESHIAGRIAESHGVPFAILRIVCDPAERNLPKAALVGMRKDGTSDIGAVLRALAASPGQLPGVIRLARDAGIAFGELKGRRKSLGDDFAFGSAGNQA